MEQTGTMLAQSVCERSLWRTELVCDQSCGTCCRCVCCTLLFPCLELFLVTVCLAILLHNLYFS